MEEDPAIPNKPSAGIVQDCGNSTANTVTILHKANDRTASKSKQS